MLNFKVFNDRFISLEPAKCKPPKKKTGGIDGYHIHDCQYFPDFIPKVKGSMILRADTFFGMPLNSDKMQITMFCSCEWVV